MAMRRTGRARARTVLLGALVLGVLCLPGCVDAYASYFTSRCSVSFTTGSRMGGATTRSGTQQIKLARSGSVGRAPAHQCALLPRAPAAPAQKRGAADVQLAVTISSADDDELKREYQRADADGTRIFISGLLPSVDEKRLLVLLQSFKGVLDAKLAKPGVGFALFADVATADAALQRLQGAKLGGKEITVRRARSFYIQQQQQATMRGVMDQVRARLCVRARARLSDGTKAAAAVGDPCS